MLRSMAFWSDWGPNAKIESSFMDGSERTAITNDGIYWPNGLSLDFATDRIVIINIQKVVK